MSLSRTISSRKPRAQSPRDDSSLVSPPLNRGAHLIEQLEALAAAPKVKERRAARDSSTLEDYSIGFGHIDIAHFVGQLKARFTHEPFIAADIGGSVGTAAVGLEMAGCDACFVIDPNGSARESSKSLSPNRFITRCSEDMHGVPDDCFQFIISFNALTCSSSLSQSLAEIFRVLRPGGVGFVDIERWVREENLQTLKEIVLPRNVAMYLLTRDQATRRISPMPLQEAVELATPLEGRMRRSLGAVLGNGFLIEKVPRVIDAES